MPTTNASRKSATFATKLRQSIQLGELKPGARLPSMRELQKEFGIATATADRIYTSLENEGFVVRRQGAGTFVALPGDAVARTNGHALKTGYIGVVSVAMQRLPRAPIWTHLLNGVQMAVAQHERRVILLSHDSPLGWNDVEGALLVEPNHQAALTQRPAHLPCVALEYPAPSLATVMADEFEGGRLAVQHLLDLGHRRIGILYLGVDGPKDEITARRFAGYQAALRYAGITPTSAWEYGYDNIVPDDVTPATNLHLIGGYAAMQKWLQNGWRQTGCTALVTQNDHVAISAMRALREANLRVPEDVSVIGFDGTETGEGCTPRLTSIRLPVEEIARVGTELLMRQIGGEDSKPQRITLPPGLVERDSTARPKTGM